MPGLVSGFVSSKPTVLHFLIFARGGTSCHISPHQVKLVRSMSKESLPGLEECCQYIFSIKTACQHVSL